ncbi:MAG: T9SS type A sorting domain-containing protein [Candidatus Marinimicrobia bacterium]|nr:T9SS type A sorting domain-containing protein [Candidatus Neomarinimicrobiota bacterium]MCF7829592.1 T9SS type A sorting domain-containing protein [Candidatus Neomarinimicrobiota bacterium]MCF7882246.1 T9SS type A sorting domain-containing protein [Candidatus Neomarinimicrobiota bacterium]
MVTRIVTRKWLFIWILMLLPVLLHSQVSPTNEWVNFYGNGSTINGDPIAQGRVIKAFDSDGVLCGVDTVDTAGSYGLMPVYRDDSYTSNVDEGASPGDTITFTIDGYPVDEYGIWSGNGDVIQLEFQVQTPEIGVSPASINHGTVALEDSSSMTLQVENMGQEPLTISGYQWDGDGGLLGRQQTMFVTGMPQTIGANSSANVTVLFTSSLGKGQITDKLLLQSNDPWTSTLPVPVSANIQTDVTATNEWVAAYSENSRFNDSPLQPGDVVDVFDPDDVHCGTWVVDSSGSYGTMSIYRDDSATPGVDEGAEPGDTLRFSVNGMQAMTQGPDAPVWTANGAVLQIDLAAFENRAPENFSLVSPPQGDSIAVDTSTGTATVTFRWQQNEDPDFWDSLEYYLVYDDPGNLDGLDTLTFSEIQQSGLNMMHIGSDTTVQTNVDTGRYDWTVISVDSEDLFSLGSINGNYPWDFTVYRQTVGTMDEPGLPKQFTLNQNYPNPFNPSTTIQYALPKTSQVTITVYDIQGHRVTTLVERRQTAGTYSVQWDGTNIHGEQASAGVYFYYIDAGDFSDMKRMVLLK